MSRIDELIAKLCPDGVPHRALGEVGVFVRGNGLQKKDLVGSGVPAIHYGQVHTHYGVWASETKSFVTPEFAARLRKAEPGDLVIATTSEDDEAVGKAVAWLGGVPAAVSGDAYVYRHSLEPKYVAYFFQSERFQEQKKRGITGTKVRRVSGEHLAKIRIPVPPLQVQREIVRILDLFTTLEAELEAELEARRRQYAHYRDSLLTFSPAAAQWVPIEELFELRNGYTPSKRRQEFWSGGTIPWFRMEDIRGGGRVLSDAIQHVTDEAMKNGGLFPANSLIVATSATIGEHALITVPFLCNQRFTVLTPKPEWVDRLLMKYVLYYGFRLARWCQENTKESSFASVDMTAFRRHRIPIPPLEEQRRIVEILDKFDALVNDLSSGLPAEIAARRKQYEYYRDKLLTFGEKVD